MGKLEEAVREKNALIMIIEGEKGRIRPDHRSIRDLEKKAALLETRVARLTIEGALVNLASAASGSRKNAERMLGRIEAISGHMNIEKRFFREATVMVEVVAKQDSPGRQGGHSPKAPLASSQRGLPFFH